EPECEIPVARKLVELIPECTRLRAEAEASIKDDTITLRLAVSSLPLAISQQPARPKDACYQRDARTANSLMTGKPSSSRPPCPSVPCSSTARPRNCS
ncbi:MAG: hypothetical protein IJM81_07430, partial [Prevotella sp.]|nr:hypothetical protein [Prevotella sp.]